MGQAEGGVLAMMKQQVDVYYGEEAWFGSSGCEGSTFGLHVLWKLWLQRVKRLGVWIWHVAWWLRREAEDETSPLALWSEPFLL